MLLSCSSVSGSERTDVGESRPRNPPFLLLGIPSRQLYAGRVLQLKPPFLLLCLWFSVAKKENGLPHPDPALGFGSSSDTSILGKLSPPPPRALWPESQVCRGCHPDPGPIPASSQRQRSPSPLLWHFPKCGGGAAYRGSQDGQVWPVMVTICASAHSRLGMNQLSTPEVSLPNPGQLETESRGDRGGPTNPRSSPQAARRPQDHWQAQSVGSCTV